MPDIAGEFSGPSRSITKRQQPTPKPTDQRPPAESTDKPRLPRSHRKEIKRLYVEEAAQRGESNLPSRSARARAELQKVAEAKAKENPQREMQEKPAVITAKDSSGHEEEPEAVISPQQQIYNISRQIQQLLLANNITAALSSYTTLKAHTTPNEEMVRQMIAGLCRNDRVADAISLFEEYKLLHPDVTNQLYGAVLLAIGMAGDLPRARYYFEQARAASATAETNTPTDSQPNAGRAASRRAAADVWLYARMIKVLGRHKKLEELLSLLEEVNALGFPQNSLFCATVMEAFGNCGATNLALSLLEDLKKQKFPIDIHVYNALLQKLSSSNEDGIDQQADAIFLEMPLAGVRPDACSFAATIRAVGTKPQNISRCIELFEGAQTALCLSVDVYDAMILSYLTAQRVGDAVRLYEAMKPRYAASLPVLSALLTAARKTENDKLRDRILEEMRRRGLRTNMSASELSQAKMNALDAMKRREVKIIFAK